MLNTRVMDIRFALRSLLKKNLGFTLVAVLILALGIGANTAVFSVVNVVLLRPLDYKDAERIVTLWSLNKKSGRRYNVSGPDYHDWRSQSTAFEAFAYHYYDDSVSISVGNSPEYAEVAGVTSEFFRVMGTGPALGPGLTAGGKSGAPAIVISNSLWRRSFNSDPNVLGRSVRLLAKEFTVTGVMPPGFHFPGKTDLWFDSTLFEETTSRSAHNYRVIARLKPGASVEQADAQLKAIADRLERQYPENVNKSAAVLPLKQYLVGEVQTTLYLLLGAVALVLLIACANVAGLLLARSAARTREMAVRAALGASRWTIVRQLLVESLALGTMAGTAGFVLGVWGTDVLVRMAPAGVPRLEQVHVDLGVLAFTLALSLAACVLFGLAPGLQAARVDLSEALKSGARNIAGAGGRLRQLLVVAEVALSVVLLTGAALLLRSFVTLTQVDLGIRTENVLAAAMDVPSGDEESARKATTFYTRLLPDLRTLPGVVAVGGSQTLQGGPSGSNGGYFLDGRPMPPPSEMLYAGFRIVSPGYFETLKIPLHAGREFSEGDLYEAPFVAIVNEAFVKQTFRPGEDPMGRRLLCGLDSPNPMTIVGVVADVRENGLAAAVAPEIYMPYTQHPTHGTSLQVLLRTAGDPVSLANTVRSKAREIRTDVPVRFDTVETIVSGAAAAPRFRTLLLGIFACVAMALAMAGIYGLMAYMVARRSAEIGVRMALGARAGDVMQMVLGYGMRLAVPGVVLGLAGALAVTRLMQSMLFGVKATDPATYAVTAGLLLVVSLAAGLIPASRAAAIDPVSSLRQE
jgi:predicted permease